METPPLKAEGAWVWGRLLLRLLQALREGASPCSNMEAPRRQGLLFYVACFMESPSPRVGAHALGRCFPLGLHGPIRAPLPRNPPGPLPDSFSPAQFVSSYWSPGLAVSLLTGQTTGCRTSGLGAGPQLCQVGGCLLIPLWPQSAPSFPLPSMAKLLLLQGPKPTPISFCPAERTTGL